MRYVAPRNAGIDGVVENISIYERIGYRLAYHNMRYQGLAREAKFDQNAILALSAINFADLVAYDRLCFPAPRDTFYAHGSSKLIPGLSPMLSKGN